MSKSTPGPWKIYDHTDLGPYEGGYWIGVEDPECGPVTFAASQLGCEEAAKYADLKANARLIAAAPEMLEALKHARMLLDELAVNNPDHPDKFNGNWDSYRYEFDAVIAGAEGA